MSRPIEETITCKGCGWEQAFAAWESLNATLDPERKRELISGDLRVLCV